MSRRLVRWLVRLAPAWFRERYGAELIGVHERRTEGRGTVRRWLFEVREVVGLIGLVVRLWLGARRPRGERPGGGETMLGRGTNDLRLALRGLRRNPAFTLTAIGVLAVGIGANAAVFAAVDAFFFRPLPFRDADRLVMIYETNPGFGWTDETAAPANVLDWREQVEAFEDVAMYSEYIDRVTYVRDGEPLALAVASVSGNFFSVLGAQAERGRTFRWEETWEGRDDVVVMSHALWQSMFGGDPDVVGRILDFDAASVEVVGVMPEGLTFPGAEVHLWSPWGWAPERRTQASFRRAHWVRPVARLRPGVSLEEAEAQLEVVASRLQAEYPETNATMGAGMAPLRDFLVRGARMPMGTLMGAVILLLVLACVNVANLALVRAGERRREVALRRALGAADGRIAGLVLTESLVVAAVAGALGLGLGWLGIRAMDNLAPLGIEGATGIALDHRVLMFTLATAAVSGLLFALAPILRARAGDLPGDLRVGAGTNDPAGLRASRLLVAAEVALALLLAVGAGLMARTFAGLRGVDPGFRTENVLAVRFELPSTRYPERSDVLAFYDRFLEAVEGRPGVERAGTVGALPLDGPSWSSSFQAEGWPPGRVGEEILHRRADRAYFETLGIPLIEGRHFGPGDDSDGPLVVVVNETFAREYFPGEDPIGRRIAYDRTAGPESTWYEIVGIVGDQHQESTGIPPRAEVFENRDQDWGRESWVVVRTATAPLSAVPTVREVLAEMDPLLALTRVRPLREVWRQSMAREELVLALLGMFGAVALLLSTVGVYAVATQAARQRTREIGIRMALGAEGRDVVRLVLRQGMTAVLGGLAAGLMAAVLGARTLESLLFGVRPTDAATFAVVTAVLLAAALVASWLPARRAVRVDPVRSLRTE